MKLDSFGRYSFYMYRVAPVIDHSVRGLCVKPYPGHKKGCPKFYKGSPDCPPQAPFFENRFDLNFPVFAVVVEFDMKSHMAQMKRNNPDWSESQQANCLYWQKGVVNELERTARCYLRKGYDFTLCPEANGVNITATMERVGVILEWPPRIIARKIALLGKVK